MIMMKINYSFIRNKFSFANLISVGSFLVGVLSLTQCFDFNEGKFVAILGSEEAESPVSRNIVVFMVGDSIDLQNHKLFPQIYNPSKYSLKDVLLTYKVDSENANISYSDFYSVHKTNKGNQITNNDKTLYPKSDMPNPFLHFYVHDNDLVSINLKATYRGVTDPFSYDAKLLAKKSNIQIDRRFIYDKYIFTEAYYSALNHLNIQNNDKVDVYILSSEHYYLFPNMIVGNLKGKILTMDVAIRGAMHVPVDKSNYVYLTPDLKHDIGNQIQKTKEKLSEETTDNDTTPLYIKVVKSSAIVLLIPCVIFFFLKLYFRYKG